MNPPARSLRSAGRSSPGAQCDKAQCDRKSPRVAGSFQLTRREAGHPLRSHWHFPRADDGLHPTARGDLLIAERVAGSLIRAGAVATSASRPSEARVACTVLGGAHDHLG